MWIRERSGYESDEGGTIDYRLRTTDYGLRTTHSAVGGLWSVVYFPAMRDYTKIMAWRLADDLTVAIYERTRGFPKEEMYGVTSQIRRSSFSVPANIAEGASRNSQKEYLHFL